RPRSGPLQSRPLPPAPWTRTRGRPDPASRQWVSRPWTTGLIRDLQQGGEPTSLALLDPPGHRGEGRTAGRPGLQDGAAGGDGPERLDPIPADGHAPGGELDRGSAVAGDQPQPVADAERGPRVTQAEEAVLVGRALELHLGSPANDGHAGVDGQGLEPGVDHGSIGGGSTDDGGEDEQGVLELRREA